MGKGLTRKLTDKDFVSFISKYDVVCLSECWLNSDELVSLENYECITFPRKCGKGGGIVIFYKNNLCGKIHYVENIFDSIISLKLTPTLTDIQPTYIAFCYIPPEGSVFYDKNDVDLYQCLEDSTSVYRTQGRVFITGDMNSRCGGREDFFTNDFLSDENVDI